MQWFRPARLLIVAFLLLLPALVFHRALFLGEAFLPADLLGFLSPWNAAMPPSDATPAWNVLRYDGIGQFYPWRLEAARQMHAGAIPLWNPYQLGADGGTPLLANSQSAPLYPINLLFYILPVWQAFGVAAALHLLIAAAGMYLFLRALPISRLPALLGAAVFCLSGPVIVWLGLPTFLAVSCWLPLLLLLVRQAHHGAGRRTGRLATVGAGAVGGMILLAGHLQMAFYCLLAAFLYAIWLGMRGIRHRTIRPLPWIGAAAAAGAIAIGLAMVQVLPSLALSRVSHRAAPATWEGYLAYSSTALPVRNLAAMLVPDFFGQPNSGTYWNSVNYSEWTLYIGVLPLMLAFYAAALPVRRADRPPLPPERFYLMGLAAIALLMAFGTPINIPLVFGVPGFAQTGSPARSLILVAFALSALAALGLEVLLQAARPARTATLVAIAAPLLMASLGASAAATFASENIQAPFGELLASATPGLMLALILFAIAAAALVVLPRLSGERATAGAALAAAVAVADLLSWGIGFNATAPPGNVYPVTEGIAWLQENARDALIAPINRSWSLTASAPRGVVLPPNALTVYRLHDLSGYDSLLTRASKERVRAAGGTEPSPPENGNIVFIKSVEAAVALGARYLVFAPQAGTMEAEEAGLRRVYAGADMVIYENRTGKNAVSGRTFYGTSAFQAGLFIALAAVSVLIGSLAAIVAGRRRPENL